MTDSTAVELHQPTELAISGSTLARQLADTEAAIHAHLWDAISDAADMGPEGLAWLLRKIHLTQEAMKDAYAEVEQILADVLPGGFLTVDHLGTFERKEAANRKQWDRDAAANDVAGAVTQAPLVDPQTGETGEWTPDAVLAALRMREALGTAFRFEPRAGNAKAGTGLRGLGLDPDSYATVEPGRVRVKTTWAALPSGTDEGTTDGRD